MCSIFCCTHQLGHKRPHWTHRCTNYFRTHIGDTLVNLLGDHRCSASLWAAISSVRTASADTTVQELTREFYQIRLGKSTVAAYLESTMKLCRKISELSTPIPAREVVATIIAGLPESYTALKTVLRQELYSLYPSVPNHLELLRRLIARESELAMAPHVHGFLSDANAAGYRPSQRKPTGRGNGEQPDPRVTNCNFCKKPGHVIADCPDPACRRSKHCKKENDPNLKPAGNDAITMVAHAFATHTAGTVPDSIQDARVWVVDSGCTRHVTGRRELFASDIEPAETGFVQIADKTGMSVLGKGTVALTHNNNPVRLSEVLYAAGSGFNLFSVRAAGRFGVAFDFNPTCPRLYSTAMEKSLFDVTEISNLYTVALDVPVVTACPVVPSAPEIDPSNVSLSEIKLPASTPVVDRAVLSLNRPAYRLHCDKHG